MTDRRLQSVGITVSVVVAGAAIAVLAFHTLPWLLTRHPRPQTAAEVLAAQNAVRGTVITALLAVGAAATASIAWRTYSLTRQSHVTDRYSRAIEQIGHNSVETRLGAIYALERLAKDSNIDRLVIREVLAAFIRVRAPLSEVGSAETNTDEVSPRANQDVEAAFTVLARSTERVTEPRLDLREVDLTGVTVPFDSSLRRFRLGGTTLKRARLARVDLSEAALSNAILDYANLSRAVLGGARCDGSSFVGANMTRSTLVAARLVSCDFRGAVMSSADLTGADMRGATLRGALLDGAVLSGCDLSNADLTSADLRGVILDSVILDGASLLGAWIDQRAMDAGVLSNEQADQINWVCEADPATKPTPTGERLIEIDVSAT